MKLRSCYKENIYWSWFHIALFVSVSPADDGKLSLDEFQAFFSDGTLNEEELEKLFHTIDSDNTRSAVPNCCFVGWFESSMRHGCMIYSKFASTTWSLTYCVCVLCVHIPPGVLLFWKPTSSINDEKRGKCCTKLFCCCAVLVPAFYFLCVCVCMYACLCGKMYIIYPTDRKSHFNFWKLF